MLGIMVCHTFFESGHAIGIRKLNFNHSLALKEPFRLSKWADVSPLLKYISGAVAPRVWAAKRPFTRVSVIRSFAIPILKGHVTWQLPVRVLVDVEQ